MIKTERLFLRKPETGDAEVIAKYLQDKDISRYTLRIPYPYSFKDAQQFIENSLKNWKTGKGCVFFIEFKNKIIGTISLDNIDKTHRNSELGYWLAKPWWGKKIMSEAVRAVITFGFKNLGLKKIIAHCITENIASWKIMENFGMKREGELRNQRNINGKFVGEYVYGILKEEWKA